MTLKDLLRKATVIVAKYFDVNSIKFNVNVDYEEKRERMTITVFYSFRNHTTNFHASVLSSIEPYSVEQLLKELKKEVKTIHLEYFPDTSPQTTDLEIEVEQIIKQVNFVTQPRKFESVDETKKS